MISQTVEYALRAMVHLAAVDPTVAISSEMIARQTRIPQGYLSKILRDLVVSELIHSQRGPNGGFKLARPAGKISLLDVITAVDPIARIKKCPLGNPEHLQLCPLHGRIDGAIAKIEQEFKQTTLAELLSTNVALAKGCQALVQFSKPR